MHLEKDINEIENIEINKIVKRPRYNRCLKKYIKKVGQMEKI